MKIATVIRQPSPERLWGLRESNRKEKYNFVKKIQFRRQGPPSLPFTFCEYEKGEFQTLALNYFRELLTSFLTRNFLRALSNLNLALNGCRIPSHPN